MNSKELECVYLILETSEEASDEQVLAILNSMDEYILLAAIPFITSYRILKLLTTITKQPKILKAVANNRYTPAQTLHTLVINSNLSMVCRSVASHPNTSEETLSKLNSHPEFSVRASVVSNPKTELGLIFKALDDEHKTVRDTALQALQNREDSPYHECPSAYLKPLALNNQTKMSRSLNFS